MVGRNITLVIFGGTGDLAKRKLVPAIANLSMGGKIGSGSVIIGIARSEFSDESYKKMLIESAKSDEEKNAISKLTIKFFRGDVSDAKSFGNLREFIENNETRESDRIFYLATSYKLFPSISSELGKQGLHKWEKGFTRIVFEKPFGSSAESSNKIDKEIHEVFSENQVFRIDHYLAKETVQNITTLKLANPLFEQILNKNFVESIEVIVDENIGVDNRIAFYDEVGAIKDVVQNHLLQVLSLILMNPPILKSAANVHDEKVKALRSIKILDAKQHLLGQYISYNEESKKHNIKDSKTETFAKIALQCNNERWSGTNIILRTGKKLEKKYGQIRINFKPCRGEHCLVGVEPNKLIIDIYPKQDVKLIINTRKPGNGNELEKVSLDFAHEEKFGPNSVDEYSTLINEVIKGEMTLFTRFDELQESWRIVEDIESIRDKIKFFNYPDFSNPELSPGKS